jgi:hypothetical protein
MNFGQNVFIKSTPVCEQPRGGAQRSGGCCSAKLIVACPFLGTDELGDIDADHDIAAAPSTLVQGERAAGPLRPSDSSAAAESSDAQLDAEHDHPRPQQHRVHTQRNGLLLHRVRLVPFFTSLFYFYFNFLLSFELDKRF